MLYYSQGSAVEQIDNGQLAKILDEVLKSLGPRKRVLVIPPDMTRFHSRAGYITELIWYHYGTALAAVLPALGTHCPMPPEELDRMFGAVPHGIFRTHNWRSDVVTLGELPSAFTREISGGKVDYPMPVQVNRLITEGDFDLIISVGQVVPHEVIGMANYTKNLLIGTGGSECINKSHFLGAACDMETILGRTDNPVRTAVDTGFNRFLAHLPILFIQTVIGSDDGGHPTLRGLYIGDDRTCFEKAAALSRALNITLLKSPPKNIVAYLDPEEFKSTWLGNKSIYRARMAIADGGRLIVLAPGVASFGEDRDIDRLIRTWGYCGTAEVLRLTAEHEELRQNLSAAAHLIHGSTEGRFTVTYCSGGLTREEIESVGYEFGDAEAMIRRYQPKGKLDGTYRILDRKGKVEEEYYFISNPALGLWAAEERFETSSTPEKE